MTLITNEEDYRLILKLARCCEDKYRVIGDRNDFALARTVLESALNEIEKSEAVPDPSSARRQLLLEYARAWLNDPEVHPWRGTEKAWGVFSERIPDVARSNDAEALALIGKIHRRRWELSAQSRDLRRAVYFFQLAFGADDDDHPYHRGLAGYQAALLMVELARLEERAVFYLDRDTDYSTRMPTIDEFDRNPRIEGYFERLKDGLTAGQLRAAARRTMTQTVDLLRVLADSDAGGDWQVNAATAAGLFGLQRYDEALNYARRASECPRPGDQELQSWAREFAIMARQRGVRPEAHSVGEAVRRQEGTLLRFQPEASAEAEQALSRRIAGEPLEEIAAGLYDRSIERAEEAVLEAEQKRVFEVVKELGGSIDEDIVFNTFAGKVGLALSGGGFRASLYHVGVLAALADLRLLRHVQVISSVSGGSITATCYYALLRELLSEGSDGRTVATKEIRDEDYVALIDRLCDGMIEAAGRNLRARLVSNLLANLGLLFNRSPSTRLGDLIESIVLPAVTDGHGAKSPPLYLSDLVIHPLPESAKGDLIQPAEFRPRRHNWTRSAKVPILIMNATALNTGHNWQLTVRHMGEPPTAVHPEIDVNPRLRRIYFESQRDEAPASTDVEGFERLSASAASVVRRSRDWMGFQSRTAQSAREYDLGKMGLTKDELQTLRAKLEQIRLRADEDRFLDVSPLRLGHAVAASAAVPGLFEPLPLEHGARGIIVKLSDGGVVDNQGITGLTEQGCDIVLVSDAAGQLTPADRPAGGLFPALRSNLISLQRIRSAQYEELRTRRRAQQIRDFIYVHLTAGLDSEPVRWVTDARRIHLWPPSWFRSPQDSRAEKVGTTAYGIDREVQSHLAAMRTDLDSFSEVEAHALMTSGYLATRDQIGVGIGPFRFGETKDEVKEALPPHEWSFLDIADGVGEPADPKKEPDRDRVQRRVRKHLAQSDRRLFRWLPKPLVSIFALAALLLVVYLMGGALTSPGPVLPSGLLITFLLVTAGLVGFVWLMASLRDAPLSPIAAGWKVFLAGVSMVLMVFSWPYLLFRWAFPKARRGRVDRYLKEQP